MGSGLELSHVLEKSRKTGFSFLGQPHESGSGQGPTSKRQGWQLPTQGDSDDLCLFLAVFVQNLKNLWTLGLCPRRGAQ